MLKNRVIEYVRECHSRRTPPRVKELAQRCDVPVWKLCREFNRAAGVPLGRFMLLLNVRRGVALLSMTDLSLDEVAGLSGFGSSRSMHRAFRNVLDLTPSNTIAVLEMSLCEAIGRSYAPQKRQRSHRGEFPVEAFCPAAQFCRDSHRSLASFARPRASDSFSSE